ncbi:MAG TPA: hypothetical protein ENN13_04465 [Candidatus Altiarchaeales archaeon]|nr:hypothetical protein [Candidatus Altiarchaeales archaeon]
MDCVFCGKKIPAGTESIYVDAKGKANYFCSRKCEKNMINLGRKPRKTRWTRMYMEEKALRLKSSKPSESNEKTVKKEAVKEESAEAKSEIAETEKPKSSGKKAKPAGKTAKKKPANKAGKHSEKKSSTKKPAKKTSNKKE